MLFVLSFGILSNFIEIEDLDQKTHYLVALINALPTDRKILLRETIAFFRQYCFRQPDENIDCVTELVASTFGHGLLSGNAEIDFDVHVDQLVCDITSFFIQHFEDIFTQHINVDEWNLPIIYW